MIPACIDDYRTLARRRLPRLLFDYIDGGAFAEATLRANSADFGELKLRQRVLNDVSDIRLSTRLFGQDFALPVGLSPVGVAGMNARRGEVQAALAAKAAGVPFCLSTVSICGIAEVAKAAGAFWFQLYMIKDRGFMAELLAEAEQQGCTALLFTVDLPLPGIRYRDVRSGMNRSTLATRLGMALDGAAHPAWVWDVHLNGRPHLFGNLTRAIPEARGVADFWQWVGAGFDPSITWKDIEWVRSRWSRPLIIKGVLDPEDAREAVKAGAEGLIVSNHGGRQLDSTPSTISALPGIVDAVGDDITVLMDGGVRSGLDVVKALALGAKACFVGRPWAWALAARGQAGVASMLEMLRAEMRVALALTGCTDVSRAGRDMLAGRP